MQSYWVYQRRDNLRWEGIIEEQHCEVADIDHEFTNDRNGLMELANESWVAGSLHLVEAESLAEALVTVMPVGEVIRRMFDDVLEFGNEFTYHKWFANEDFDENGGMNKEAAESLRLFARLTNDPKRV